MAYKKERAKEIFRPKPGKLLDQVREAMNAILFLYKHVLGMPFDDRIDTIPSKKQKKLPTVLSQSEIRLPLACMSGTNELMAKLLYGAGLRLMECIRLRVKDVDFENHQIIVRDGKGADSSGLFS